MTQPFYKICPTCNTQTHPDVMFCTNCGGSLQGSPVHGAQTVAYQQNANSTPAQPGYQQYSQPVQPPPMYQANYQQPIAPYQQPNQYQYQVPQNYVAGDKNKVVAALLAFFAGPLGLHGFYLGNNQMGLILLLSNVVFLPLACIIIGFFGYALVGLVCLAQAILYLVASDGEFYQKYVIEKRWF